MKQKKFHPLRHLTVIDLSVRLPGPLAAYHLANLGAQIIKIEDTNFTDPFNTTGLSKIDPSFGYWYKQFNKPKKIIRVDFKDPKNKEKIHKLLSKADGLILGLPKKYKTLLGLTHRKLSPYKLAVLEIQASHLPDESLHDLNALAKSGALNFFLAGHYHNEKSKQKIIAPPFLPWAGITYAHQLSLELLATIMQTQRKKKSIVVNSPLLTHCHRFFNLFWDKKWSNQKLVQFLHNGAFPCYNIYLSKDGQYVALAAIEEKYWLEFINLFHLDLKLEDRFSKSPTVFNKLSTTFCSLTHSQIQRKLKGRSICLSFISF